MVTSHHGDNTIYHGDDSSYGDHTTHLGDSTLYHGDITALDDGDGNKIKVNYFSR